MAALRPRLPAAPRQDRRSSNETTARRPRRLLRQGRRIPTTRRRPLPRRHPLRRTRRTDLHTPRWATLDELDNAVHHAAAAVSVATPETPNVPAMVLRWGPQVDLRTITTNGDLTEQAVAAYIAKYATKAAECVGTLDRRIHPTDDLTALKVSEHARRLIAECLRLGSIHELTGLRLTDWAHMLGFRGHFSTKSRRYSTTLSALRAARAEHSQARQEITTGRLLLFDEDHVVKVSNWRYLGQGLTPGEALLTAALTGQPVRPLDSTRHSRAA